MRRRPAGWHVGRVVAVRDETRTARRIEFEVPSWPGNDAGAHVDVRLTSETGYQASRSYSIASSGEGTRVVLAVDEVRNGEVSPYLVRGLAVDDELDLHGPLGHFFVWTPPEEASPRPVQLIAGGSGVVPLYAIASAHERAADTTEFRLLYSVRTPDDVYFKQELLAMRQTAVDLVFTRRTDDSNVRRAGRLTQAVLAETALAASREPRVFVCGPTAFVEAVADWLLGLGHDPMSIRTERFGGA